MKGLRLKLIYIIGAIVISATALVGVFFGVSVLGGFDLLGEKLVIEVPYSEQSFTGSPVTSEEFVLKSGELQNGHVIKVVSAPSLTMPEQIKNQLVVGVFDADGNDVSGEYNIDYEYGDFKLNPIVLKYQTDDIKKEYDGESVTDNSFTIISGELEGVNYAVDEQTVSQATAVGVYDNKFDLKVTNANGEDISAGFIFDCEYGKLDITKRLLGQEGIMDCESTYNGTSKHNFKFDDQDNVNLLNGDKLTVECKSDSPNVGNYNLQDGDFTIDIFNAAGEPVTDNYELSSLNLTINQAELWISSVDVSKEYPNEAVNGDNALNVEGLIAGHTIEGLDNVNFTGEQKEVGYSANEYTFTGDLVIWDGSEDVTANYKIEQNAGMLNVYTTEKVFTLTASSSGSFYFKERSFGEYVGSDAWADAVNYDFKDGLNPQAYFAKVLQGKDYVPYSAKIERNTEILKQFIVPYYATLEGGAYTATTTDNYYEYNGELPPAYSLDYYSFDYINSPAVLTALEDDAEYYNFVCENYINVRESTKNVIIKKVLEKGVDFSDYMNIDVNALSYDKLREVIIEVTKIVSSLATYEEIDYSTVEGNDSIEKFLNAEKGVCRHFAAVGTLMYRMLGLPARYTIGYLAQKVEMNEPKEVSTKDYHAWVEVYLKGYGWVPIEVTFGDLNGGDGEGEGEGEGEDKKTPPVTVFVTMKEENGNNIIYVAADEYKQPAAVIKEAYKNVEVKLSNDNETNFKNINVEYFNDEMNDRIIPIIHFTCLEIEYQLEIKVRPSVKCMWDDFFVEDISIDYKIGYIYGDFQIIPKTNGAWFPPKDNAE